MCPAKSVQSIEVTSTRPLLLRHEQASLDLTLFVSPELWAEAESARDNFRPPASDKLTESELLLCFLKHVKGNLDLQREVFESYSKRWLPGGQNPHAIMVGALGAMELKECLAIYYDAMVTLRKANLCDPPHEAALFKSSRPMLLFGGQGSTEAYLDELQELHQVYGPLLQPALSTWSAALALAASAPHAVEFMSKGLNVMEWLENSEKRPAQDYLVAAPVSLPLVGLIQLLNYWVMIQAAGFDPKKLPSLITAASGHSQGIVSAVAVASSANADQLIANGSKALRLLLQIGLRSQQAYPTCSLSPEIISDSLTNGEGVPTPMLSISGLPIAALEKEIATMNGYLPAEQQIRISLFNGPRSFVCSASPFSLYGLNRSLRKLKADHGQDQAKIPHSQRRLRFTTRFLPISSPFHCPLLQPAVQTIMRDVVDMDLSFDDARLLIPVHSTDTGAPLSSSDLTQSLVEQICIKPVKWTLATARSDIAHVIDLGPGHGSGIGALTHRNKDGSGVQVNNLTNN